jgi:ribonuclease HII
MRIGADEAGKGPVLGSMFAAAVRAPPEAIPDGVDDSKRLSPARREALAADLREDDRVEVGVAEIPVRRIDGDEDMNTLTVAAHADAIDAAAADGDAGLCDAGDTSEARFARRVAAACERDVTVRAEHGADDADPLVAAASVVAKVARDAHVAGLADAYGDVGSGYPSDPTTRAFLREYVREHGELPACARASWSTCDDVLAAAAQSALDEF